MPSKRQLFEEVEKRIAKSPKKKIIWSMLKAGHPVPIIALFEASKPKNPAPTSKPIHIQKYVGANVSTLNKILALYDLRIAPGDPRATYVLRPLI